MEHLLASLNALACYPPQDRRVRAHSPPGYLGSGWFEYVHANSVATASDSVQIFSAVTGVRAADRELETDGGDTKILSQTLPRFYPVEYAPLRGVFHVTRVIRIPVAWARWCGEWRIVRDCPTMVQSNADTVHGPIRMKLGLPAFPLCQWKLVEAFASSFETRCMNFLERATKSTGASGPA